MGKSFFVAVLVFFSITTGYARAETPHRPSAGNARCGLYYSEFLRHEVGYCVDFAGPRVPGERVVYFMHGLAGSSWTWIGKGYAEALQAICESQKCDPISFISFDTAPTSFFSDARGEKSGSAAYETWFLVEFMPMMEKKYSVCNARDCRGLLGLSMGGFGAIKTSLRHPELFSVVAANSPALKPFSIFQSDVFWWMYWSRHPIGGVKGMVMLDIVREVFPTENLANQNDPTWLAGSWEKNKLFPSLYFDMGDRDDFGFQEGYAQFSKVLKERNLPHASYLIPGGDHHELPWERRWIALQFLLDRLN